MASCALASSQSSAKRFDFAWATAYFAVYVRDLPCIDFTRRTRYWHWKASAFLGIWVPMFNDNLLGGPLFEEFGWRGFLQIRLQREIAPWRAAFWVGLLWAAWHLLLFLVSWSSASPFSYALIMISLSMVFAYAFNSSGGSVLVAILMHSAFNSSSRFIGPFLDSTPTHEHPSAEVLIGLSFCSWQSQ